MSRKMGQTKGERKEKREEKWKRRLWADPNRVQARVRGEISNLQSSPSQKQ